jgi:hypothetical protein
MKEATHGNQSDGPCASRLVEREVLETHVFRLVSGEILL